MPTEQRRARMFRQREQDWRAVTVDHIAALAGIAKGTVYLHVRSKEEVAARLALRYLKRLAGAWSRVPTVPAGRARLLALLDAARALAAVYPGQFALVQASLAPPAPGGLHSEVLSELGAAWAPLDAALCACFAEGSPSAVSGHPLAASALAWTMLQAVSQLPPLPPPDAILPDAQQLLDILMALHSASA